MKTSLTDPKYGQALTPEAADAELAQIAQESTATLPQLDIQNMSEAE